MEAQAADTSASKEAVVVTEEGPQKLKYERILDRKELRRSSEESSYSYFKFDANGERKLITIS